MTYKEIFKIAANLLIIYTAGGLLLALVYASTSPIIFKNNEKYKQESLQKMVPEADSIQVIGDWHPHEKHAEYYEAKKGGESLGYIVQSFGKGYSSYINVLFSVDNSFIIKKINVLHHAETPGLGDEIETEWFEKMFEGKDIDHLKVYKDETKEYIQAITGATISTRAVSEDAIKNGLEFLKKALKERKIPDKEEQKVEIGGANHVTQGSTTGGH